jgi:very-short-patch-repair endonuclease
VQDSQRDALLERAGDRVLRFRDVAVHAEAGPDCFSISAASSPRLRRRPLGMCSTRCCTSST